MADAPDRRLIRPSHVRYIDKSREFYAAKGFERPYEWAAFDSVPFAKLRRPLTEARVAVVTTSFPHLEDLPPASRQREKGVYHMPVAGRPERMFTADLSWDKNATHTDDPETFLPLARLAEFAAAGRIGAVNDRFFGVPTEYSQRQTGMNASAIAAWCAEDSVDAVVLVPL